MNVQVSVSGFENRISGPRKTFRAIIEAMAHPGRLVRIKSKLNIPDLLNPASAATCLTFLFDEAPLWADLSWNSSAISWFQFHCGCSIVTEPCMAHYALITRPEVMPPLNTFKIGGNKHPESATTLIVQVEQFNNDKGKILSVPGMKTTTHFAPEGIPPKFWEQWQFLAASSPLGMDVFFTCNDILAALPGKTEINDPNIQRNNEKSKPHQLWEG